MEQFTVSSNLRFSLPLGLSSDPEGLMNILTNEAWKSLSVSTRNHLKRSYLPAFPENNDEEQEETLSQLFSQSNFCFGNPLEKFVFLLWEGWMKPHSPPLLELQKSTQKVLRKKFMFEYHHKLLKDLMISRQTLVDAALQLGPSQPIKMKARHPQSKNMKIPYQLEDRIKRRYLRELQGIKAEVDDKRDGLSSDDEQELGLQDGGGANSSKRSKRDGSQILFTSQERFEVKNTFIEKNGYNGDPPFEITDEMYRNMLRKHRKNRRKNSRSYEYDFSDITLTDIIRRVKVDGAEKKLGAARQTSVISQPAHQPSEVSDETSSDEEGETQESSRLPTESDADDSSPLSDDDFTKDGDNEDFETHACFFSLIRDVICSFEGQTASVASLRSSIRSWQETNVAAANDWFSLIGDVKWDSHLSSALAFLAGHSNLKDAVARLPRGQGTKTEIQDLLLQSQYITLQPEDTVNLNTFLSSALDKIQFDPDPCCKYDPNTRVWIYLHKTRTEEEMERIYALVKDVPPQSRVPGQKRRKVDSESPEVRPLRMPEAASFSGSPMQMVNPAQVSGKTVVQGVTAVARPALPVPKVRPATTLAVSNQVFQPRPVVSQVISAGPRIRPPVQRAPLQEVRQATPPAPRPMARIGGTALPTVRQVTVRPPVIRQTAPLAAQQPALPAPAAVRPIRGTTIVVQSADGTRRQVTLPPGFQATAENIRSLAQAMQRTPGTPQPRQASPVIRTVSSSQVRGPTPNP